MSAVLDSQSFVHLFLSSLYRPFIFQYILSVTLEFLVEGFIVLAIPGLPCCLLSCRVSDENPNVVFNFVSSCVSFHLVVPRISLHSWLLTQRLGLGEGCLFLFDVL